MRPRDVIFQGMQEASSQGLLSTHPHALLHNSRSHKHRYLPQETSQVKVKESLHADACKQA